MMITTTTTQFTPSILSGCDEETEIVFFLSLSFSLSLSLSRTRLRSRAAFWVREKSSGEMRRKRIFMHWKEGKRDRERNGERGSKKERKERRKRLWERGERIDDDVGNRRTFIVGWFDLVFSARSLSQFRSCVIATRKTV